MPNIGDSIPFSQMDKTKTIWENINEKFYIPKEKPFMVMGDIKPDLYKILKWHVSEIRNSVMSWNKSDSYYGVCLNYNPCLKGEYYQYSEYCEIDSGMNSYEDSLGFFKKNYYGLLFHGLFHPFDFVRSKLSILKGNQFIGDWHRDEDQREVVKVVVPITGGDSYKFQIEGMEPFTIPLGQALVFDASTYHRLLCESNGVSDRVCLVFSVTVHWSVDDTGITFTGDSNKTILQQFTEDTDFFEKS